jgi:hypothetical protein
MASSPLGVKQVKTSFIIARKIKAALPTWSQDKLNPHKFQREWSFLFFSFLVQTNMASIAKKIKVQSHPRDKGSGFGHSSFVLKGVIGFITTF